MLPGSRTDGEVFSIPQFSLAQGDVEGFLHELRGFHEAFRDCFGRREPREQFFGYMVGQCSALERKSIEPMALQVDGGNVRAMQRLISDVVWDEVQMRRTYHTLLNEDLGDAEGVLIFDESGFPKKGRESVGVARQCCGTLGKVENCQVGVFAAYAARRTQCKVPDDLTFHTKPQLAVEILREIYQEAMLTFKYIVADCLYGNSPEFIEAAEQCGGKIYFVSIPSDTRCWVQGPVIQPKRYTYKGETRAKRVVRQTEKTPLAVEVVAKSIHDCFWYRRKVSEGTRGPIEYEFTKRQVMLSKDNLPYKAVWLVMKRTIGAKPTYYYYITHVD
jgi:SRSO17 transposase